MNMPKSPAKIDSISPRPIMFDFKIKNKTDRGKIKEGNSNENKNETSISIDNNDEIYKSDDRKRKY